jgi:hypothetical protein
MTSLLEQGKISLKLSQKMCWFRQKVLIHNSYLKVTASILLGFHNVLLQNLIMIKL